LLNNYEKVVKNILINKSIKMKETAIK